MGCLIIKKEHLDKILNGEKTWEIRGSKTHKRGKIGLIQSGSGTIVGECELIDCTDELSKEEFINQVSESNFLNSIKECIEYFETYLKQH